MVSDYKLRELFAKNSSDFMLENAPSPSQRNTRNSEREKFKIFMKSIPTTVGEDMGQSELIHSSSNGKLQSLWKTVQQLAIKHKQA